MDPAERKRLFAWLSVGHDIDELASRLGYTRKTLAAWRKASHPRAPSEEALRRLRHIVVAGLADRIRTLSLDAVARPD